MATGLWLTKKSEANLVILYSEIIFDATILEDLLAADGDIVLVVDRRPTVDAEDEKVVLAEDRVVRAATNLPLDEAMASSSASRR